jgi:DnaJ-like protein
MHHFERLAEQKILQAFANGEFNNLPGAGKPLRLRDDSMVPAGLRMAYKLLKDANCLPPELELHKEILRSKDLLESITEESERTSKVREINFLITKLNLLRQRPLSIETRQMVVSRRSADSDANAPDAKS